MFQFPVIYGRRREEEIDFIAFNGESAVFGECKWKNAQIGEDVLNELMLKADLFPQFKRKGYALFSKPGFTKALTTKAENDDNIMLIGLDEMFLIGC